MKAIFPARRFRGIGATRDEVVEMEGAFNRSDLVVQHDLVDYFKSLSSSGLRAYLANWRGNDAVVEFIEDVEPAVIVEVVEDEDLPEE